MTSKIIANGILRAIGTFLAISLFLFFIYKIKAIFIYIIISLILILITKPIIIFFKKKLKLSNLVISILILIILLLFIIGLIAMFIPLIISQSENLALLDTNIIESNSIELIAQIKNYLELHNIELNKIINTNNISSKLNFNFIPEILNSIIGTLSSLSIGLVAVLFITFFLIKDSRKIIFGAVRALPNNQRTKILKSFTKINTLLSRYFIALLIQLTIVFILYFIVLIIFDVKNSFIIAFLCALLNIVPYVGPMIGTILAAILTMMSNLGSDFQQTILPTTIYVLIGFSIVQFIDNNISQPIIFSKSVNSHPLEIFLVTLISGILLGITGMIIAIPTYTILKVIAKEFLPDNNFIKILTKNT